MERGAGPREARPSGRIALGAWSCCPISQGPPQLSDHSGLHLAEPHSLRKPAYVISISIFNYKSVQNKTNLIDQNKLTNRITIILT